MQDTTLYGEGADEDLGSVTEGVGHKRIPRFREAAVGETTGDTGEAQVSWLSSPQSAAASSRAPGMRVEKARGMGPRAFIPLLPAPNPTVELFRRADAWP